MTTETPWWRLQFDPVNWRSAEGGDAGTYIDTSVATQYWWNGVAPGNGPVDFANGLNVGPISFE